MRNPRQKKLRDLRKAWLSGDGFSLYRYFDKLYPEYDWRLHHRRNPSNGESWSERYHAERKLRYEWLLEILGADVLQAAPYGGNGNSPAHFRRDLNRHRRAQEKQALREAIAHGDDWDEIEFPHFRRNANWLWW